MPELPEVETIRRDLAKLIIGGKILDISTDSPKQVQPSFALVKKAIVGATIEKIKRRAKLLQIFLSNNKIVVIHLKLTGRVLIRKKGTPKDQHQHVTIKLKAESSKQKVRELELRFCDLRKFGWVKVMTSGELKKVNQEFGPEPSVTKGSSGQAVLTLETFGKILSSTRRPIKVLLMDQKKISGIGNIYACDALFLARIYPGKKANSLNKKEQSKLFDAIEKVLKDGLKYRGASDQFYLDALGRKGSYQKHFLVYGRWGEKCMKCSGKIGKVKLAGRGTYYCPVCQKI